ncbi:DUF1707 SHOCT-like domain-containing protein [Pseudosporangium ferrugineum]|uniref:Uncharacterized protein DUF1707 n=1 Tax=Pseudosporangium ferrugineum TaxID=439699 RepID=A0A2T0SF79_9ACTN|nr:DUF1707 domain-containing protein [Pseudosporangium ferrugineum]PRY32072.1 uncharacterized protein DUF1707 [Pseudosporangium ferrugineum]
MSGDIAPSNRTVRISDAEREQVIARLSAAVAEGRLTMSEFEERVDGVVRARTHGDVEPFVADLPAAAPAVTPADVVELRSDAGHLKRTGRWSVPRRLVVRSMAGMVKLDLRHAVIPHPVVEIALSTQAGSTTIVLPRGATADIDGVTLSAGSASLKVPSIPEPGSTSPHFVITGSAAAGSLLVRYERRFWRWTW